MGSLDDLVEVVERSASVNKAQVVAHWRVTVL